MMFSKCKVVAGGLFALIALSSLLTARPATAQTSYTGTTTGGPTFKRPQGGNPPIALSPTATATPYHTFNFTPTQTARYKIVATTSPTWDNFIAIYQGTFDPANGLTNCLAANDDFGNSISAGVDAIPLTGGQTYVIVVCGFSNGGSGAFETVITQLGPTNATTGQPNFNRPNANGNNPPTTLSGLTTAVPYSTVSFTPTVSGPYRFVSTTTTPGFNNFTILYQNSFNPASPLTNALIANEDLGSSTTSGFEVNLTFGTPYIFVTTGSVFDDYGVYSANIQQIFVSLANDSTTGRPRYNRPNAGFPPSLPLSTTGTDVPYRALKVRVATSGNYSFTITRQTSTYDPFTSLYSGSFNPTAPINNIIVANDDKVSGNTPTSGFDNIPLLADVDYFLVVTGFDNLDEGDFSVEVRSTAGQPSILRFIAGNVTREDCPNIPFAAEFILRPPDNSGDLVIAANVDAAGNFTIDNIPSQSYQVKVKMANTLSDVVQTSVVNGDVVGLVLGPLQGGDADNNNSVDVLDLDLLIQFFDTCQGDPGYDARADFDCNDCVDVLDLDVLIRNFDEVGEDFS
jgi:hypothetical protein